MVVQAVKPFLSAKDIDKGAKWIAELSEQLEDTNFAIVCLAPDNLASPWLHYEAGAISKSVGSRVCPVLFHVKKADVSEPLKQLQMTDLTPEDVQLMVSSINKATDSPLGEPELIQIVLGIVPTYVARTVVQDSSDSESRTPPTE